MSCGSAVLRGTGAMRLGLALTSFVTGSWVGGGCGEAGTVIGLKKAALGSGTGLKKVVGGGGPCTTGSTETGLKRETGATVGGSG